MIRETSDARDDDRDAVNDAKERSEHVELMERFDVTADEGSGKLTACIKGERGKECLAHMM
jgi:hypothetical protein